MAKPEHFAVIGHPVSHSLSPQMYQFFMDESGATGKCYRATGLNLSSVLKMLHDLNIRCFNVTHPYKQSILNHLSSMSPESLRIKAVNTVLEDPQKGLIGMNTDHTGIRLSLLTRFRSLTDLRILLVGAGGAARAAAFALGQSGATISLANRNQKRGRLVAKEFSFRFLPLNRILSHLPSVDAVVWTIPGYPPDIGLPLRPTQIVLDANYNISPEKDYFGDAKRIDGLDWLIHQGWQSFCAFTGQKADSSDFSMNGMHAFLKRSRNRPPVKRIVLVGFMGAGKTTIGKRLSSRLGWDFLDTDVMCEATAGKPISAIFHEDGEDSFRHIEREQVEKSLQRAHVVIALGGGAIMTPGISQLVKSHAFTIWLYQPEKIIEQRCSASSGRPLFAQQSFKKLMDFRTPSYLSACDLLIDSENSSVDDTANFLLSEIRILS